MNDLESNILKKHVLQKLHQKFHTWVQLSALMDAFEEGK